MKLTYLFNQAVLIHNQKVKTKLKYLENEKSFWGEIKSIFHYFQRALSCQKFSRTRQGILKVVGLTLSAPPGVFLSDHATGGRGHVLLSSSCLNPDRKMLLTWNMAVILCNATKKMVEKFFIIEAAGMMTSLIMSIFWEIMRKMAEICFFSKIKLVQLEKRFSRSFFSFWKSR